MSDSNEDKPKPKPKSGMFGMPRANMFFSFTHGELAEEDNNDKDYVPSSDSDDEEVAGASKDSGAHQGLTEPPLTSSSDAAIRLEENNQPSTSSAIINAKEAQPTHEESSSDYDPLCDKPPTDSECTEIDEQLDFPQIQPKKKPSRRPSKNTKGKPKKRRSPYGPRSANGRPTSPNKRPRKVQPTQRYSHDEDYKEEGRTQEENPMSPTPARRSRVGHSASGNIWSISSLKTEITKAVDIFPSSIPDEIVFKIFGHAFRSEREPTTKELLYLGLTCEKWRRLILNTSAFWTRLDLNIFKDTPEVENSAIDLAREYNWDHLSHIDLTGWNSKAVERILKAFVELCGHSLTSIVLKNCPKISSECLELLAQKCPNLSSLDISGITGSGVCRGSYAANNPFNTTFLKGFLEICGTRLTQLNLAQNDLHLNVVATLLMENCPNLTLLDLSNTDPRKTVSSGIYVEKIQEVWPKMKVLRLANVGLIANRPGIGFDHLEELSIPTESTTKFGHDDAVVYGLCKKSENLRLLDIRGSTRLSVTGLLQMPSWSLQSLYLSKCSSLCNGDLHLVFSKWNNTLQDVDLSWNNKETSVNGCLEALANSDDSQLRSIQLRGSAVTYPTLKELIKHCPRLQSVDLESCRWLPRGIKRLYAGEDFQKFKKEVLEGRYDEPS